MRLNLSYEDRLRESQKTKHWRESIKNTIDEQERLLQAALDLAKMFGGDTLLADVESRVTDNYTSSLVDIIRRWASNGGLFLLNRRGERWLMALDPVADSLRFIDHGVCVNIDVDAIASIRMARGQWTGALEIMLCGKSE